MGWIRGNIEKEKKINQIKIDIIEPLIEAQLQVTFDFTWLMPKVSLFLPADGSDGGPLRNGVRESDRLQQPALQHPGLKDYILLTTWIHSCLNINQVNI